MAIQLQIRRGTTAENDLFTGAVGELTMDTDTKGMRLHDGSTQGGVEVPTADTADYVVEWQTPTDLNNYTWYRKYKSGWVEQGGRVPNSTSQRGSIPLPVTMASTNYTAVATGPNITSNNNTTMIGIYETTTTDIKLYATTVNTQSQTAAGTLSSTTSWLVYGMGA